MAHLTIQRRLLDLGTPQQVARLRELLAPQFVMPERATMTTSIERADGKAKTRHDLQTIANALEMVHGGRAYLVDESEIDRIATVGDEQDVGLSDCPNPTHVIRLTKDGDVPKIGAQNRETELVRYRLHPDSIAVIEALAEAWSCSRSAVVERATREALEREQVPLKSA